jgi:phosphoglucomutase
VRCGLFLEIGEDVLKAYIARVKDLCIRPDLIRSAGKTLKLVYTPLHGAGNKPVRRVLSELGFEQVIVVPAQELPDSEFSTVAYPNPEEPAAFAMALDLAQERDADVVIATDPDCDRVGVAVKDKTGAYRMLTGNQTGALLVHYVITALSDQGRLPKNGCVIKTIVTSELGRRIAEDHGVYVLDTLTGFKFIGEKIKEFEETGSRVFLIGYEESYGYLAGDFVRDKDAVIASMLISEMAAYYKSLGMTLYEGLEALWQQYGFYKESLKSLQMEGKEGMEKIGALMEGMRADRPQALGGIPVAVTEDYRSRTAYDHKRKQERPLQLPASDVLRYTLEDGSWFCIRPSGTEPKVKIYFSCAAPMEAEAEAKNQALMQSVMEWINTITA